jgi:eukaryotic-like serine/threonine-protein kinase
MTALPSGADPERLADVVGEAMDLPPGDRGAFLDVACRDAPELRAEAESLLRAHERARDFMERLDADRGAALLGVEEGGRRVGPYRLLRELGRGGMGVVHLAERVEGGFEQRAAIKLVKRGMDSDAILRRFLRERQILASLEHAGVARLLDGGVTEDGQPYFAMEYVEGEPLTAYCDRRHVGVEERLRLFEEACRAVQHAHGRLVVHRDLKPSNMLVTAEGRLKLLDFGIAKLLAEDEETAATALTRTGTRLLTPDYAAPEQVRGERVTTATDVYALGVVLYELLTGRLPHRDGRPESADVARAVCEVEPRPPSLAAPSPRLARRLRGDLDTVVLKALSKEPSRRYASAEALAEDVRRHLAGHPVQARRDTIGYVVSKFVRRHKVGVATAALTALSLMLGLLGTVWQARVAARERDHARVEAERAEKVKDFLIGLFKASDPERSKGETITARELLERGTDRIENELAGHPSLQAELLDVVAGISQELGRYDRARKLAEQSLERARQAHGPEHPQVARAMDTLGWTLHRLGDYAASEDLRRQALAMRRRLLAADSPEVADSLVSLGLVLRVRAKLDEAEALQREALAIRRQKLGPEHPDTANAMANLADVLYAKGDYAAAADQHREALRIRRKALGDLDPAVAFSLVSLGGALLQEGDRPGAEAAHREALAIRRRIYGEEHPAVSESLHHLAATFHSQGNLPAAEAMYRQALALDRKLKGEEHRDVAVLCANLAYALAQQGRFDEAMPLFDRAVALHRRVTGTDNPLLARALQREAGALIEQGRPREALPLLTEALGIFRTRQGPRHPMVASALGTTARARAELGDSAEAETLYREALEIQRQARPRPDPETAEMLAGLGELLTRAGRAGEAEPLLREAMSQADRSLPPGHWRRGEVESVLGSCLWRLGRREEARSLLAAGHDRLRQTRGDAHPATRRARRRLDAAGERVVSASGDRSAGRAEEDRGAPSRRPSP